MPDDEMTAHEKQALVNHWLARGNPALEFGKDDYVFNLQALLHCSDPIVVEHCRRHTPALRRLLRRSDDAPLSGSGLVFPLDQPGPAAFRHALRPRALRTPPPDSSDAQTRMPWRAGAQVRPLPARPGLRRAIGDKQ